MRRLSLLFAAALMACALQTAVAAEEADSAAEDAAAVAEEQPYAECYCPGFRGGWGGAGARGPAFRRGGPGAFRFRGQGPALPPFRQGQGQSQRRNARGSRNNDGGMGMINPRFMEELGLTEEQKTQIIDAATENFRERLRLRWELAAAQEKLRELRDTGDYEAIVSVNETIGGLRGRLDVARRKVEDQFNAILTPGQHEQFRQFREEGEER